MIQIVFGSLLLAVLILVLTLLVVIARSVLMPVRPAKLTVNSRAEYAILTGQKLLASLNDSGVLVPSACAGAGTCGLCRVQVKKGAPDATPIEVARFSKSELSDDFHLACQVVVRSDMDVQVPEDMLGAETYECRVVSNQSLTPLIREVVLQLPSGTQSDIVAGSFVQVTAPAFVLDYGEIDIPEKYHETWQPLRTLKVKSDQETTRAYSVSDRPADISAGLLVLNVRLALPPPSMPNVPPGIVSSWLFGLQKDAIVPVSGPFGSFRAQDTEREMVFIGGGVGMAPLRAIIHEQLESIQTGRKMSFWFGARSKSELFYKEEMDLLAANHPNFDWIVALSSPDPSDGWTGPAGFVHSVVLEQYLAQHPSPENCEYYLCGPPLMIRAVLSMLDDLGVESENIFNDDFGV